MSVSCSLVVCIASKLLKTSMIAGFIALNKDRDNDLLFLCQLLLLDFIEGMSGLKVLLFSSSSKRAQKERGLVRTMSY